MRAVCTAVFVLLMAWAAAALPPAQIEDRLRARMQAPISAAGVPVIVSLREAGLPASRAARRAGIRALQQGVLDGVPGGPGGFRTKHRYESAPGFSGWASRAAIETLERHPDVARIYLDGTVHAALVEGRSLIGADLANFQGFTGAGVRVAVLDTGIDSDHVDLADDLVHERCYCDQSPPPFALCCPGSTATASGSGAAEDDGGHGTSVSGIITSAGNLAPPGVAPDAEIVAIKVLSGTGSGRFSDIDAALDWVLTNHSSWGIRVVTLSLSDGGEYDDAGVFPCAGTLTALIMAALEATGVSVFSAAGNDAFLGGVSFPACVPSAVAVGGVYDANVGSISWCGNATCTKTLCTDSPTGPDAFVCHTNSGSLLDLLAPNFRTRTTAIGGVESSFGGTSASTPYAAAEAALLYQAAPATTPAQVRGLLTAHGPMVTNSGNGLSFPRSDVAAALTVLIGGGDGDGDGVPEDGDGSGTPGDAPCASGVTLFCDDNCPNTANPGQADADGDGIGDACEPPPAPTCGLGPGLALLLPALAWLRRRRSGE